MATKRLLLESGSDQGSQLDSRAAGLATRAGGQSCGVAAMTAFFHRVAFLASCSVFWQEQTLLTAWNLTASGQSIARWLRATLSSAVFCELHCFPVCAQAMAYGRVVIVTNALEGWVETSCAAFLPGYQSAQNRAVKAPRRTRFRA